MADRHTSTAQATTMRAPKSIARAALRSVALPLLGTGIIVASTLVPDTSAAGQALPMAAKLPPYKVVEGVELSPAFIKPVQSYRTTAEFGDSNGPWAHGHTGLDFAAPTGTLVRSIARGQVVSAAYDGSYGNKVVIRLKSGVELWFCHLVEMYVAPGEQVLVGTEVGEVGSTGNSTGPHLHLEVHWPNGTPTDPAAWLQSKGVTV